jgi:hypothetical protein
VEERIDNVLSLMTRQEKMDFLGKSLDLPRLGIHGSADVPSPPGSGGQLEGLHGIALGGPGDWGRKSPGVPGGEYGGDEVVQMYVQHLGSKVDRPGEELKGFERVSLQAGEAKTVRFRLPARDLAYWDEPRHEWTIEHDRVRVMIGSSSADIKAQKVVAVTR